MIDLKNLKAPKIQDQYTLGRRLTMRINHDNLEYFTNHRELIHNRTGFARVGLFVMQAEQCDYSEKIKPETPSTRFNTKKNFNVKFYLKGQLQYINEILLFLKQFDDDLLRDIFEKVETMDEVDFEKQIQNFHMLSTFIISCIDSAKYKHQQTQLEQLTRRAQKLQSEAGNIVISDNATHKPRKKGYHQNKKNTQFGMSTANRATNTIAFKSEEDLLRVKGPGIKEDPNGNYPCVFNYIRSHSKVNKQNLVETQTKLLDYVVNNKLTEINTPTETKDYNFKYSFKDCPRLYSENIDKNALREAFIYLAALQEDEIHKLIDLII